MVIGKAARSSVVMRSHLGSFEKKDVPSHAFFDLEETEMKSLTHVVVLLVLNLVNL